MKVVGREKLSEFSVRHPDTRNWIVNWLSDVEGSDWKTPHDIKNRYATASFLAENFVVFNIRGNEYRLETRVLYPTKLVIILWIGTHADYTKKHS